MLYRGIIKGKSEKIWVYGSLLESGGKCFIVECVDSKNKMSEGKVLLNCRGYEVEPDSLGRYFGFDDVNGVRVFEKDVCNVVYDGDVYRYVVVWDSDELGFKATNGMINYGTNFEYLPCCEEVEVVGNLVENPDMALSYGTY